MINSDNNLFLHVFKHMPKHTQNCPIYSRSQDKQVFVFLVFTYRSSPFDVFSLKCHSVGQWFPNKLKNAWIIEQIETI